MRELFKKNKVWLLIAALVVVALATSGYFVYKNYWGANATEEDDSQMQTSIARQGDLTIYASAAGVVIPVSEIGVGFDENGTVTEILINVGDQVDVGDALARLQTDNTEESIALDISNAKLEVLNAQNDLDSVYDTWEMDVALALQAIAEAKQDVEDMEVEYNRVFLTANQAYIDSSYADMLLAEEALEKAEENYEPYANKPDDNLTRARLLSELSTAQLVYDNAVANYNANISPADEIEQAVAEANLALAKAKLIEAEREYARIKSGPDPDDVALAEAELANAEAQLDLAMQEEVILELLAPISGKVISIDVSVGEEVGTGSIIILADLSQPLLEIYLDEGDMDKVAVGYEVEVVFDAFPDEIFTGQVIEVNPSLQTISNVSTVKAKVLLDVDSSSKPDNLLIGMNASVELIGGNVEDAVLIPIEALREIGPNEYAVFVMEGDEPRMRIVTVGLVDYTTAAITSGLEVGEIVTTGLVETE
jgi:HlyD family secretion protein